MAVNVQLLPDRVRALSRIPSNERLRNPELDTVRAKVEDKRLICFGLQLHQPGDLIVPGDFARDESNAEALYNMAWLRH